jgi:hypothetical protein
MAQLLVTIGPWLAVLVSIYLATMTPSYYAHRPRWLIATIRTSAAFYGATIVLRQIFIATKADTAGLVCAILGLISVGVTFIALVYARAGRSTKPS